MGRGSSLLHAMRSRRGLILGLVFLLLLWRMCLMALGIDPVSHDPQDSYTLQAMAWRQGRMDIPDNEWSKDLELAQYGGRLYVSFPPVPTLPMWVLTLFFGQNTPNRIVNLFYFLSSYLVGYSLCKRHKKPDGLSAVWAAFLVAGCNLTNLCWFGGVWYQAQALSFLLTLCAFRLLMNASHGSLCAGLCALALAVGCRPFQAVYVLPALAIGFRRLHGPGKSSVPQALSRLLLLCVPPLLIGAGYGLYNLARFGSFFEFGHTFLPEFQKYGPQFSIRYFTTNLSHILRLPAIQNGRLTFPLFFGFAFYLTNPLFLLAAVSAARGAARLRLKALDGLLLLCLLLHFFLLLLHRTFGGWQFGTRYLIDLCPALFLLTLRHPTRSRYFTAAAMLLGLFANVYGGLVFHLL